MMDDPFPEGMVAQIATLLAEDRRWVDGEPLYPHIFESSLFFPLQRMREARRMIVEASRVDPRIIMEIGADKGGGVYQWVKALKPEIMIANEIRGLPYAHLFDEAFPATKFLWLEGSSYDAITVERTRQFLSGRLIDVLFIDGDKAQFMLDFELYVPLVRHGGVVFMHDITDPAPGEAFYKACTHGRVRSASRIIDTSESLEADHRERAGEPATTAYEAWLRHWKGQSCGVGVLAV